MKIEKNIELFNKNLVKQIPKDIAKRIPLLETTVNAIEETERQIEQSKRDKKISSIHSRINQISKDVQEIVAFSKIKEKLKKNSKKHKTIFRSEKEILDTLEILFEKVWFDRHQVLKNMVMMGKTKIDPEIWKGALMAEKRILKKYGKKELGPWSDFDWGMLNGKLSALRWILKEDWDMLDT
ncbi:MAG: hypothetical protein WC755_08705 [Candidatus Woesearchaeota archaeon]|jgi:hypothetical protein